jgi:lauroyl/myristoyl acyltransferase
MKIKKEAKMKRKTYYFTVGKEVHKVTAESMGHAMQWMNRQVMDQLNKGPWAWMDDIRPNHYFAVGGNYWD